MKYLAALVLLLAACAPEKVNTAEVVKFDQPAAGIFPVAFDDNCTGCEATYPDEGGAFTTYLFDRCLYITHYLYWWTTNHSAQYDCYLSADEMTWVNNIAAWYRSTQAYIAGLSYDPAGNYCRVGDSCGSGATFYKLVPFPGSCGVGNTRVYVPQATYDDIIAAADAMTCSMCFLRTKCGFQ